MKRMLNILFTLVLGYALLLAGMVVFQRRLMYYPDTAVESPSRYGLVNFEELNTTSADGINLQLWYRPAAKNFPTIVYFHGNAGHIGNRAAIYGALAEKGFGLLALSYRGYGKSHGAPTESGLYSDARAAINYLTDQQHIPIGRIMIYGESLGSGVAVQMATEYKIGGLILEAPYTSVVNRAAEIYYYIPVRLLISDHYDSIGKIGRIRAPLLLFHGELDNVIPVAHGRALLEACTQPKQAVFFPQGGHNGFDSNVISSHVLTFAQEHHLIAP